MTDSISFLIPKINYNDQVESSKTVEAEPDKLVKEELRLIVACTYEQLQLLVEEDKFISNTNRRVAGRRFRILSEINTHKLTEVSNKLK